MGMSYFEILIINILLQYSLLNIYKLTYGGEIQYNIECIQLDYIATCDSESLMWRTLTHAPQHDVIL